MKKVLGLLRIGLAAMLVLAPALVLSAPIFKLVSGKQTLSVGGPNGATALSSAALTVPWVMIKALAGNAQIIYVGDSTVTSTTGLELSVKETVIFGDRDTRAAAIDLSKVYIVGTTSDGVTFLYPAFN